MENMVNTQPWTWTDGEGPIVATAIHDGAALDPEVAGKCVLALVERQREEDPYTAAWTEVGDHRLVVDRSRFQVDFNRPRERCVYRTPAEAWGLTVWQGEVSGEQLSVARRLHDQFYAELHTRLAVLAAQGPFVVLDLHSYNHRREGYPASQAGHPDINLGTAPLGDLRHGRWANLVERFMRELREAPYPDGPLDVRENVKFPGGWMGQWIMAHFPDQACVLSVEFKKIFMDEWSGELNIPRHRALGAALAGTIAGLREELSSMATRG